MYSDQSSRQLKDSWLVAQKFLRKRLEPLQMDSNGISYTIFLRCQGAPLEKRSCGPVRHFEMLHLRLKSYPPTIVHSNDAAFAM